MPTKACLSGGGEPACTCTTSVEYEPPCGMRPTPTGKSGARVTARHGRMEFVIEVESVMGLSVERMACDRPFERLPATPRLRNR